MLVCLCLYVRLYACVCEAMREKDIKRKYEIVGAPHAQIGKQKSPKEKNNNNAKIPLAKAHYFFFNTHFTIPILLPENIHRTCQSSCTNNIRGIHLPTIYFYFNYTVTFLLFFFLCYFFIFIFRFALLCSALLCFVLQSIDNLDISYFEPSHETTPLFIKL